MNFPFIMTWKTNLHRAAVLGCAGVALYCSVELYRWRSTLEAQLEAQLQDPAAIIRFVNTQKENAKKAKENLEAISRAINPSPAKYLVTSDEDNVYLHLPANGDYFPLQITQEHIEATATSIQGAKTVLFSAKKLAGQELHPVQERYTWLVNLRSKLVEICETADPAELRAYFLGIQSSELKVKDGGDAVLRSMSLAHETYHGQTDITKVFDPKKAYDSVHYLTEAVNKRDAPVVIIPTNDSDSVSREIDYEK